MKKFFLVAILAILCTAQVGCVAAPKTQALFSPQDNIADKLIEWIDKEEECIQTAVYCLTHRGIVQALVNAKKRSVAVEVIVDPFSLKGKALLPLVEAGIPLYVWNPEASNQGKGKKIPLMHDKFCLLGQKRLWTGSFNFTYEASRANKENVIVMENGSLVTKYRHEFEAIKVNCLPYQKYVALFPQKIPPKKGDLAIISSHN